MSVLYENRQRAKRARFSILAAVVWSVGWFYWANVLWGGGSRPAAVAIVVAIGLLPLVALYFYGNVYVVRYRPRWRHGRHHHSGLLRNRNFSIPLAAILEVDNRNPAG